METYIVVFDSKNVSGDIRVGPALSTINTKFNLKIHSLFFLNTLF